MKKQLWSSVLGGQLGRQSVPVLLLAVAAVMFPFSPACAQPAAPTPSPAPTPPPAPVLACVCKNSGGACIRCPLPGGGGLTGGGGGGTIQVVPGGAGCGDCMPVQEGAFDEAPAGHDLRRAGPVEIDLQALAPERTLAAGDAVTLMLARAVPGADTLLQPLMVDDKVALYTVQIGEDGNTAFTFGTLAADAAGGSYVALAVEGQVDAPEDFWEKVQAGRAGWQRFNVDPVVALAQESFSLDETARQLDVPATLDPAAAGMDVQFVWRKDRQPLPQAAIPLLPGIYNTLQPVQDTGQDPSADQGTLQAYAPFEFVVQNLAPGLGPQLGPYFTPGAYEIDVLINGVLESTTELVIP